MTVNQSLNFTEKDLSESGKLQVQKQHVHLQSIFHSITLYLKVHHKSSLAAIGTAYEQYLSLYTCWQVAGHTWFFLLSDFSPLGFC